MAAQFLVEKKFISGAVGQIELAAHIPENSAPRAVAVVAHPHPLFGGTMDNKVTTTLARACFDCGAATYRFNFRGVGKSEGTHDEGRGETADLVAVIQYAKTAHPNLPLWLAGFSFGGAVALAASNHSEIGAIGEMVLVAPAFERMSHWKNASSGDAAPAATLLIHGEKDETVPLVDSFTWAMTREIAVCVVPGADHFFHSRLHIIRRLVLRHFGGSLVIL
jgi:alpha/beta superfamily hydrolase